MELSISLSEPDLCRVEKASREQICQPDELDSAVVVSNDADGGTGSPAWISPQEVDAPECLDVEKVHPGGQERWRRWEGSALQRHHEMYRREHDARRKRLEEELRAREDQECTFSPRLSPGSMGSSPSGLMHRNWAQKSQPHGLLLDHYYYGDVGRPASPPPRKLRPRQAPEESQGERVRGAMQRLAASCRETWSQEASLSQEEAAALGRPDPASGSRAAAPAVEAVKAVGGAASKDTALLSAEGSSRQPGEASENRQRSSKRGLQPPSQAGAGVAHRRGIPQVQRRSAEPASQRKRAAPGRSEGPQRAAKVQPWLLPRSRRLLSQQTEREIGQAFAATSTDDLLRPEALGALLACLRCVPSTYLGAEQKDHVAALCGKLWRRLDPGDSGAVDLQTLTAFFRALLGPAYGPACTSGPALVVVIEGGKGLPKRKGSSKPYNIYCVCEVAGQPKSHIIVTQASTSLNPFWNCKGKVAGYVPGWPLEFSIFANEGGQEHTFLGGAVLDGPDFWPTGFAGEVQLIPADGFEASPSLVVSLLPLDKATSRRTSRVEDANISASFGRMEPAISDAKEDGSEEEEEENEDLEAKTSIPRKTVDLLTRFSPRQVQEEFKDFVHYRMHHKVHPVGPSSASVLEAEEVNFAPQIDPQSRILAERAEERVRQLAEKEGISDVPRGDARDELVRLRVSVSQAKIATARASRADDEVRECTFTPQLLARQRPRAMQRAMADLGQSESASASTSRLAAALGSRKQLDSAENSEGAQGRHAAKTRVYDHLYTQAMTKQRVRAMQSALAAESRMMAETSECTFKPDLTPSVRSFRSSASAVELPQSCMESWQRLRTASLQRLQAHTASEERLGQPRPREIIPSALSAAAARRRAEADSREAPAGLAKVQLEDEPIADVNFVGREEQKAQEQKALLNVEVSLREDQPPELIVVREGDQPGRLAADFAARHVLSPERAKRLYNLLHQQMTASGCRISVGEDG
mmetsp:Transcript_20760/g.45658  ORF Transcript_20760/g.45658 Transcript_20760/m.45658 type:complete len:984 (-) Transcript_20760:70-3021(-)